MTTHRALSPEQTREVRLSMEATGELAKRYGASRQVIQDVRAGRSYGALRPDELAVQARRLDLLAHPDRFRLEYVLLIIGDQRIHGGSMDRQEAKDAAHECSHGRLSHDPTPACGCWPGELAVVVGLPVDKGYLELPMGREVGRLLPLSFQRFQRRRPESNRWIVPLVQSAKTPANGGVCEGLARHLG